MIKFPKMTWHEVKKLLEEEARHVLSDEEYKQIEADLRAARLVGDEAMRDLIAAYLQTRILDAGEQLPFRVMEGTPEIDPFSHSLIVGMTDSGKTVYANIQAVRIALEYVGVNEMTLTPIVVDTEGDRAPFIVTQLEKANFHKWLYFDAGTIRENIYELATYDPMWFDYLARVFVELGWYGDIGLGNLRQMFMDLNGAGEMQRRGGWATLDETLEFMRERKGRSHGKKQQYLEVAVERFENWIPAIAHIFRHRSGHPWSQLKGNVIIYDIRSLTFDGQLFFQNYLLQKLLFIQERGL
jgi:hypothetical protein